MNQELRSSSAATRVVRRPVHGVLLLDKPLGLSSNAALQRAKWLLRAEKAGHTGTLDPLATGVLPLCFGAATKFSQLQLEADKCYDAVARLGINTSTADAEGEVVAERPVHVTEDDLDRVRLQFSGAISQVPPMYSALKKDGRALYDYARAGLVLEREPRDVTIHSLALGFDPDSPVANAIRIRVRCSKGTYIRTLAQDIGEALGCGAHLTALRRTATGDLDLGGCVTLEALEALSEDARLASLLAVDRLLPLHLQLQLDSADAGRFLSGMRRRGPWPDAAAVAVYGPAPAALLGTGQIRAGELIPARLLSPVEIEQCQAQRRALGAALAPAAANQIERGVAATACI